MKNNLFPCILLVSLTLSSLMAGAEGGGTKAKRQPNQAPSTAACDDVARSILASNAKNKIEDTSKAADFKLKSTVSLGDAATSKVVSVYTEPSDNSSYLIEFYGEGCALKALIHL